LPNVVHGGTRSCQPALTIDDLRATILLVLVLGDEDEKQRGLDLMRLLEIERTD
jgi:hypothetical protein